MVADVGARIRSLRTAKGLTQAQVAEPQYTKAYISMLESGRTRASMKALEHIAGVLGVRPADLLGGAPSPATPQYTLLEARRLVEQGRGGSVVFVGSKNALVAGANASAYSSAKAASLHLARCLAEEGGPHGIRVNTVNPDAVIQDSGIWSSDWKAERASTYGVSEEELQGFYSARTKLGVNVYPEDVAEAIAFLAGPRSAKSTGNLINVDGGVTAAYPR